MEQLSCELCGISSYAENLHMQHIFSKKHVQNSRGAVNLDHSIHVTGFTFHTTMKDLYDHFSKFGRVKFIDMIQGHGRKKVFGKKEGNFRRSFSAFKKPNFAFVEFEKAESVETALAARHHVSGRVIYVNRRQKPVAKEEPVDLEVLQKCASVQEQIQTVYNSLQLADADRENREKLRAMVETEMKQYFPNCSVNLFGSSANGFGCKGCDVDLLLQTGAEAPPEEESDENRKPPDIPTVNQVKNGDVALEVLNKLTKSGQLQFIRRALLQNREEYISVVYIPALTCPIVKFLSKTHSLRCDLSNGRSLPLHNTALLQLYSKLDPRVAPLMTVLRRWAKTNDYISTPQFSSYTFSLMVIFFLQTRSPPVLPSVNFLRAKPHAKNLVDGLDCGFCCDVSKLERSKNRQSLETLLLEFFTYYRDFDFFEHVISPLTGRCEPKRKFETEVKSEDGKFKASYHMYIQDPFETTRNCASNVKFSVLCTMVDHFKRVVEDYRTKPPSTDDATSKTWGVSQLLGASSRRLLRQEFKRNNFSFNMIMSQKMLQNLREEFSTDESQNSLLSQVWVYDVTNIVLDVLRHILLLECEIIDAAGNNWYSRKRKLTGEDDESSPSKIIRADGVGSVSDNRSMSVSVNGNLPNSKKGAPVHYQNAGGRAPDIRNMPHFAEFVAHSKNASDEPFLCAQVTAYHKTWMNRKLPDAELISTGLENVFEDQRNVSLELVQDPKLKLKNEGKFFCEFYKSSKAGYTILDIKVDPFGIDRSNSQLFKFLKQFMRRIVDSQF